MARHLLPEAPCPCGSGGSFEDCCAPVLHDARAASTAEQLMRSRYTAHVIGDDQHLFRTWHPRTRQGTVSAGDVEWTGLRVLETWQGQPGDTRGVVEFEAGYVDRTPRIMHERSQFEWRASRWLYVGAIGAGAAEPLE